MNDQQIKSVQSFISQLNKERNSAIEMLVDCEPKDVLRIYDNLMEYGASRLIATTKLINDAKTFNFTNETIYNFLTILGDRKKFSVSVGPNRCSISASGYLVDYFYIEDTTKKWLRVDEDFSIKKFRKYVKQLIEDNKLNK